MIRYPRHPRTHLTRYRRVERRHPFPQDGMPVASWRELEMGYVECTAPDGRKHVYSPKRITWVLK